MDGHKYSRRGFIQLGAALTLAPGVIHGLEANGSRLPEPKYSALPRWRGFNLLEKFSGGNDPFREEDFQMISELGFNFVRLPMNYRHWIEGNDRRKFNEKTLSEIDQAVEFGRKYGVHVCINFHRAPGYTVNTPPENPLIWNDEETLDVCKLHWQTFAKRYADVPNRNLSFNLFNEPAGCSEEDYRRVVAVLLEGIRAESPDRLVICDGIDWGGKPCFSMKDLRVAQATRGYAPMDISHAGAGWVNSANFATPQWPLVSYNGLIASPGKNEVSAGIREPLVIEGDFPEGAILRFKVGTVSVAADLVVEFDGKPALKRTFKPGPGEGEWKKAVYSETYKIWQNIYDLEIEVPVPKGARLAAIRIESGDWITITSLGIDAPGLKSATACGTTVWNAETREKLRYDVAKGEGAGVLSGSTVKDIAWLRKNAEPWRKLKASGVGVMVGEFGSFNKTPHGVALAWMRDMLANWRDFGWGWALWNFRGSFGILDSGRTDVDYENWRGHKLDRAMLELLQEY